MRPVAVLLNYMKFSHHCQKLAIIWQQIQVENCKKYLIINLKNTVVKKVVCGYVVVAYVCVCVNISAVLAHKQAHVHTTLLSGMDEINS